MKKFLFFLCIILSVCIVNDTHGQKEMITFPVDGSVFQKGINGNHRFFFSGQTETSLEVFYRIEKRNSGGGWTSVITDQHLNYTYSVNGRKGFYIDAGDLPKDWYRVRIYRRYNIGWPFTIWKRVYKDTKTFGVGDVYFIAGQSNASGYSIPGRDETIPFFNNNASHEASRVYTKEEFFTGEPGDYDLNNDIWKGIPYPISAGNQSFKIFRNGTSDSDLMEIYPNGVASWAWSHLGYKIATKQNTPVLFFNAAYPNTSLKHEWTANGENTDYARKFLKTLKTYGNVFGAKAVLWQQGERDSNDFADISRRYDYRQYSDYLNSLIGWTRKPLKDETNKKLSWYVSEVSYFTGSWPSSDQSTIDANYSSSAINAAYPATKSWATTRYTHPGLISEQIDVRNIADRIYKGVQSDDNPEDQRDATARIHFSGSSLLTLANEWYDAIYSNYQNDGVSATHLEPLASVSGGGTSYTLTVGNQTALSGSTYYWVRNDKGIRDTEQPGGITTSNSFTFYNVNGGDFLTCYIEKPDGRLAACQPFVVPGGDFDAKAINLSTQNVSFIGGGETKDVGINTRNVDWDIASFPGWITPVYNDDNELISMTAASNTSSGARSGNVVIQEIGGGISKTITLHQDPSGSSTISLLNLSPSSGSFNTNLSNDQNTMQIGGVQYYQGLGVHADRTIVYNLNGQYSTFFGKVGRDDEADNPYDSGKVQFVIKADGNTIWTSQVHGNNTVAESFNVNVSGKNQLQLIVNQLEDMNFDHADWVDLYLSTGGGCSTPPSPTGVSASSYTINSGQSTTLSASCSVGTITWSTGQTGSSASVSPTSTTTYQVSCVNGSCQSGTVPVTITVNTGGGGPCAAISDNLTMGTWTITGQPLVARYFHGQYWLTQKVSSSPDEFVVRGAAMLQRSDVSLANSSYYNMINCFAWIYSDYGNLQVPNSTTFPTPAGYNLVYSQDGTPYYSASGPPPSGIVSGNCYKIRSLANNYYLQAMSNGEVQINANNNQNDQKWKAESVGASYKLTTMNGSNQVIKANSLNFSSWLALGTFVSGNNLYYWNAENNAGNYRLSAPSNQNTWDHEGAGSNNHLQIYGTTAEQFMNYRLFAFEGTTCPAGLRLASESSPATEEISTNYMNFAPNPSNGEVEIKVNLQEDGEVNVSITDFSGRELENRSFDGKKGVNAFDFKKKNLSSGVYLLRVKSKGKTESRKIVIE